MNENLEVYKANSLIEASYRLTPSEQGIILSCISQIRKDERVTDQTMYSVSVSDYVALTGADPTSAYRDIKEAATRLQDREVRIYDLPNDMGRVKNKKGFLRTRWIQSIYYSENGGEVKLRFSHDMLPYLTNLSKCFTKYAFKHVSKMSSSFGIRLYELSIQLANQKINEKVISLDDFKKNFQIETKYKAIKDFKKYVLEPAIRDINTNSDLWIKRKQKKTGRKISHLVFQFGFKEERKPKTQKSEIKILGVEKSVIEKHARRGETYEEAALRIKNKLLEPA
jgi:plasmid replication initiation protein